MESIPEKTASQLARAKKHGGKGEETALTS